MFSLVSKWIFIDNTKNLDESIYYAIPIFAIIISTLILNFAISSILPFYISSNQIKREIDKTKDGLLNNMNNKVDELDDKLDKYITRVNIKLISIDEDNTKLDAHISRMISYFITQNNKHPLWGIGWSTRSLIRYIDLSNKYKTDEYNEFIGFNKYIIVNSIKDIISKNASLSDFKNKIIEINTEDKKSNLSKYTTKRACKDLSILQYKIYKPDFNKNITSTLHGNANLIMCIFLSICLKSLDDNLSKHNIYDYINKSIKFSISSTDDIEIKKYIDLIINMNYDYIQPGLYIENEEDAYTNLKLETLKYI